MQRSKFTRWTLLVHSHQRPKTSNKIDTETVQCEFVSCTISTIQQKYVLCCLLWLDCWIVEQKRNYHVIHISIFHTSKTVVMQIAPGEPVPPGFEDEVKAVAEIQSKIDKCKNVTFIGLEYLVELSMGDDKEPGYICVLCEKRGDPRTIIDHLFSYKHRLKYLVNISWHIIISHFLKYWVFTLYRLTANSFSQNIRLICIFGVRERERERYAQ